MISGNKSKINKLLINWPQGTVATLSWLEKQDIYQQLAYGYERSGWLQRVGRGAYVRSGDLVDWSGAVYAFQSQLGLSIHVGGKSALELRGLGHFASTGAGDYLYLFSNTNQRLPSWFLQYDWKKKISYKMPRLFDTDEEIGLTKHAYPSFEIIISAPERAILEVLHLVPLEQGIEEASLLMEGLGNLRPRIVQNLLELCKSFKVKRLFLALAERHKHSWVKDLSIEKIDLGKGKRAITPGGELDPKYLVTLPKLGQGE